MFVVLFYRLQEAFVLSQHTERHSYNLQCYLSTSSAAEGQMLGGEAHCTLVQMYVRFAMS